MRRFASVFARRDRKDQRRPNPESPAPSDSHPSSASSSGSASLAPDDDQPLPVVLAHDKRSWKSWLGPKRAVSLSTPPPPPPPVQLPVWQPPPEDTEDDDSDPSDDDDTSFHSLRPSPPAPAPAQPHDALPPIQNFRNLVASALDSTPSSSSPFVHHNLRPWFPRSVNPPAFLSPDPSDLRVSMFRKHLIAHIHRPDISSTELAEIRSLSHRPTPPRTNQPSSFPNIVHPTPSSKLFSSSPGIRRWITRPCFEERNIIYSPTDSGTIESRNVAATFAIPAIEYSEYLDVFVHPDFDETPHEQSNQDLWLPTEPTLPGTTSHAPAPDAAPVSGIFEPSSIASIDHALTAELAAPIQTRNSYTVTPSPLRNEHSSTPARASSLPVKLQEPPAEKPGPTTAPETVKRVVRFAEDDSDDGTPLHLVRMKKKREQKANFLRQERLRRAKEEEDLRRQQQQLARQQEQEALERERRRVAMDKEKREREKAMYADAIAATRMRRETHRAGRVVSSNTNNNLLVPSTSSTSLRDSERNKPTTPSESRRFSRLPSDAPPSLSIPRREPSEFALHLNAPSNNPNHFSDSSSPSSSRPPSIAHSPLTPEYGHHSRPPSTYSAHTSSSEDVRHHSGSKRASLAVPVVAPMYTRPPMIASYPTWSGSNPNIAYIPAVPPLPDFVHDMPLLPPAAPFMKPSYKSRSSSSSKRDSSSSHSPAGSRRGSFNSSSERVNLVQKSGQYPQSPSASSSRNPSSSPHPRYASGPSSTPAKPTHQRRGSDDSRNTSRTNQTNRQSVHQLQQQHVSRPAPVTSQSHPFPTRGRPEQPVRASTQQYMQVPMMMMVPVATPMGYMNMQPYPNMPMNGPMPTGSRSASMGAGVAGRPTGGGASGRGGAGGWKQPRPIIS